MSNFITKSFDLDELETISSKSLKELKLKFLPMCCPLCGVELNESSPFDHQHMTNKETVGQNGAGLLRSMLCTNCNIMLGKIENNSKRFLIKDLPQFLINVANYLQMDNLPIIHPSESHRLKTKIQKSLYNKLIKYLIQKTNKSKEYFLKKYPYPKNGYITKDLKNILIEYESFIGENNE